MSSVSESSSRLFWLIVLSAIFPPLAIAIEFGFGWDLLWNVLLFLLIPFGGFIHSVYLLCRERYIRKDKTGYEPLNEEESVESNHFCSHHHHHSHQNPASSAAQPLIGDASPPPYVAPGTNITYDNKVQRNT